MRFGEHPAYVRAVVDFTGGTITANNVEATDANPFDGSAGLRVSRSGIGTRVSTRSGDGVTVRIKQRTTGVLQITLTAARTRFKYVSYTVVGGTHLSIDLWKSGPPTRAAEIRRGQGGCLTLDRSTVTAGLVTAAGREHGIFEHRFVIVLRGSDGRVLAQRGVHAAAGRWSGQLAYRSTRRQPGTLEVADASAKDGSLACLAQIRVTLPPSIAALTVLTQYPPGCLRPVRRPSPGSTGLVAAVLPNTITIASPAGGAAKVVHYTPPPGSYPPGLRPIQWSPDARYVATRDGRAYTVAGASAGRLFAVPMVGPWSWSPASDCALGVTQNTNARTTISIGIPGQRSRPFLQGKLGAFAFSPSGRTLFVVVSESQQKPRFVRIDLVTGGVRDIGRAPGNACCVTFGGWAPGGRVLLFWAAAGASILADGAAVQGIDTANGYRILTYGTKAKPAVTLASPSFLATCGGNLLAVVGGGRTSNGTVADKRLAFISPGTAPLYLTPTNVAYLGPSCLPDGTAVAALQYRDGGKLAGPAQVAIVSVRLGFQRYLSPSLTMTEARPEWTDSGILYGRSLHGADTYELWFAPHGTGPHNIGASGFAWDWSVTPPNGIGG